MQARIQVPEEGSCKVKFRLPLLPLSTARKLLFTRHGFAAQFLMR
jgi:hypothetical protein